MQAPSARNLTGKPVGELRLRTAWRSYGSFALSGLTPELSRAAKRRRLGRIVRPHATPRGRRSTTGG